jgi:hypothetical protein
LTDRNLLIVLAALAALIVVLALALKTDPAATSFDYKAYMLHRQGEWVSVPVTYSAEAYRIFRSGEVVSPVSNAQAYQLYRQGEWASVMHPAADLSAYHLSERTFVEAPSGFEIYRQSERTRMSAPFTPYQRSEWFGE